ncbi:hypothetical protein HMPREF2137_02410 [Hoylesella buccalis DNF00853]|uniref:Uncharacterized protein n=1 Tax=Hoylesella buccalis DNF00853 TaxID=1401074 RepID=A0A095ZNT7_9BACT|nr:hypothetical protein HMPREF2137_02410 [Hoylesella buccalis DNF00853]
MNDMAKTCYFFYFDLHILNYLCVTLYQNLTILRMKEIKYNSIKVVLGEKDKTGRRLCLNRKE